MERLPYRKRNRWSIERAGTIVLIGLSLFLVKYMFDLGINVYHQYQTNLQLKEEKDQLEKEQEILNKIRERFEEDETYQDVYLNADPDDIIYLP